VRDCAVEMHVNMSQKPYCTEIHRKSAAAQNRGPHFVRACAVEMQVNISQKHTKATLYGNYKKNAAAELEHPDQAPAFTITVRTPQCGHTVWEIKKHSNSNSTQLVYSQRIGLNYVSRKFKKYVRRYLTGTWVVYIASNV